MSFSALRLTALAVLVVLGSLARLVAANYYVAPSGNDTNAGSFAAPPRLDNFPRGAVPSLHEHATQRSGPRHHRRPAHPLRHGRTLPAIEPRRTLVSGALPSRNRRR